MSYPLGTVRSGPILGAVEGGSPEAHPASQGENSRVIPDEEAELWTLGGAPDNVRKPDVDTD